MSKRDIRACLYLGITLVASPGWAVANPVARYEAGLPATAEKDTRAVAIEAYTVRRGLRTRVEAAQAARRRAENAPPGLAMAMPVVGRMVSGSAEVPVIALKFSDVANDPYPVRDLQTQLFDGPSVNGTMSDHYREMSAGRFTVTGKVFGWVQVPEPKQTYVGPSGCNGICRNARLGELLVAALTASDPQIDFSRFDNDGPDNVPNSGDDDGFVDFVAFVQPDVGGECALPANDNIWSHRYSLMSWNNDNYQTQDTGKAGARILIDDYVIVPALDCDGRTMIQIGVFSHEFGHAFGLPDLYDSNAPAESEGIGGWGLMGAGSWGGDGKNTPHIPTHMEAWSKEFLGWVTPRVIEADEQGVELRPVESSGDVVRVDYSDAADPEDKKYLLLEYRAKTGFDRSLTAAGLLVTEINNASVQSGLVNNSVNGDPSVFGVNVIEADGKRDLDTLQNRGDQGDVFPGGMNVQKADAGHPESLSAALCNIRQSNDRIVLDVYVSRTICPGALSGAAISPVEAQNNAIIGQEVVVEGVLKNVGSNYFTDRRIVIEGVEPNGGQLAVSPPAVLESLGPNAPNQLDDLLGKTIILRGHLERSVLKGRGQSDVLIVDEYQIAE